MSTIPDYVREVRVLRYVPVRMRDGVELATTVVLPRAEGRYPAVLVRSAYGRGGADISFAQRGLALVTQDCRGRYSSGGEFRPWVNEPHDGGDTLDWIGAQPWSNGKVGMMGDSYLGGTQFAVATSGNKYLTALNPRFIMGDPWVNAFYLHGVLSLALLYSWVVFEVGSRTAEASLLQLFDIDKLLRQLPLLTLDERVGPPSKYWRECLTHTTPDAFWKEFTWRDTLDQATAPMLLTGGWYDYYPRETFLNYARLLQGQDPQLRCAHRVLVGPWTHGINGTSKLGQLDYGPEALRENDSTLRWLDCLLNEGGPAKYQEAPIRIFVMGANRWRDEQEWPLARTRFTKFYLHSRGRANSLLGHGTLTTQAPGDEPPDQYTYDPADPTPTLGGNHSIGPWNPGLYELALPGPYDQQPVERRDDVLVYTSPVLEDDLEVTGPIVVKLFAASSARDTDFVVRLSDVHGNGRAFNITEGVIRARYRSGDWLHPTLLEPGQVYEFTISVMDTSNVFLKGHRLRLDITSSNFPLWDRNLNTGEDPSLGTRIEIARQTVRHDRGHASHIVLPVIPKG